MDYLDSTFLRSVSVSIAELGRSGSRAAGSGLDLIPLPLRRWMLHHDSSLSGGDTFRRSVKAAHLFHRGNRTILPVCASLCLAAPTARAALPCRSCRR